MGEEASAKQAEALLMMGYKVHFPPGKTPFPAQVTALCGDNGAMMFCLSVCVCVCTVYASWNGGTRAACSHVQGAAGVA